MRLKIIDEQEFKINYVLPVTLAAVAEAKIDMLDWFAKTVNAASPEQQTRIAFDDDLLRLVVSVAPVDDAADPRVRIAFRIEARRDSNEWTVVSIEDFDNAVRLERFAVLTMTADEKRIIDERVDEFYAEIERKIGDLTGDWAEILTDDKDGD